MHVKYKILGRSGGMLPRKHFEKWLNFEGSGTYLAAGVPSDPAMVNKCTIIAIISDVHVVGIYIHQCRILGGGLQPS